MLTSVLSRDTGERVTCEIRGAVPDERRIAVYVFSRQPDDRHLVILNDRLDADTSGSAAFSFEVTSPSAGEVIISVEGRRGFLPDVHLAVGAADPPPPPPTADETGGASPDVTSRPSVEEVAEEPRNDTLPATGSVPWSLLALGLVPLGAGVTIVRRQRRYAG
jgi:hypothetical protein